MQYLPCPFCGSSQQEIYDLWYDGPHVLVYCECGAQAGEAESEQEANALWNTRTPVYSQVTSKQYLSCPFCGGQEQEEYQQEKYFWQWCKCGAQGSHVANKEEAIALWNTRINHSTIQEEKP